MGDDRPSKHLFLFVGSCELPTHLGLQKTPLDLDLPKFAGQVAQSRKGFISNGHAP